MTSRGFPGFFWDTDHIVSNAALRSSKTNAALRSSKTSIEIQPWTEARSKIVILTSTFSMPKWGLNPD